MLFQVILVIRVTLLSAATSSLPYAEELAAGATHTAGQVVANSAKYMEQFSMFPDKSGEVQRRFTLGDVQTCDGQNDKCLYIVFDGDVLDLTDFAKYHPPGPEVLKKWAGQDATQAMRSSGMPADVFSLLLKKFIIGKIYEMIPWQVPADTSKVSPAVTTTPKPSQSCGWISSKLGLCT